MDSWKSLSEPPGLRITASISSSLASGFTMSTWRRTWEGVRGGVREEWGFRGGG